MVCCASSLPTAESRPFGLSAPFQRQEQGQNGSNPPGECPNTLAQKPPGTPGKCPNRPKTVSPMKGYAFLRVKSGSKLAMFTRKMSEYPCLVAARTNPENVRIAYRRRKRRYLGQPGKCPNSCRHNKLCCGLTPNLKSSPITFRPARCTSHSMNMLFFPFNSITAGSITRVRIDLKSFL